jgi:hypothetical protein
MMLWGLGRASIAESSSWRAPVLGHRKLAIVGVNSGCQRSNVRFFSSRFLLA